MTKLSVDFIEEQNLRISLYVYSTYEGKGRRPNDKLFYDNVAAIRKSRDSVNLYSKKAKFDTDLINKLISHNKTLDSISSSSNFNNSFYKANISENKKSYIKNLNDYLLILTLYENDLLGFNANQISGIGTVFTSSVQFAKEFYNKGEEVILTNTAFDIDYYDDFKYDSVIFYLNGNRQSIEYSLEMIVNTAVIKFTPSDTGIYNINIYTSFNTELEKSVVENIDTYIEVK